jgi:hypothetical protein
LAHICAWACSKYSIDLSINLFQSLVYKVFVLLLKKREKKKEQKKKRKNFLLFKKTCCCKRKLLLLKQMKEKKEQKTKKIDEKVSISVVVLSLFIYFL